MKKLLFPLIAIFVVSCSTPAPQPEAPTAPPSVEVPVSDDGTAPASIDRLAPILDAAAGSSCAAYYWKDRGRAPKAYVKGVVLSYMKARCNPTRSDVALASRAATTDTKRDALAHYADVFASLNMKNDSSGTRTLRHVYTLLLGLGMRESSGRHCCGRDASASNVSSDSAEAGAFQTSWDSRGASTELPKIFERFRTSNVGCNLDVWKSGVTCNDANWKNWGTADTTGFLFQDRQKKCPALATEYAAVMLRVSGGSGGHYGPLRTKKAEVKSECNTMFANVEAAIVADEKICEVVP